MTDDAFEQFKKELEALIMPGSPVAAGAASGRLRHGPLWKRAKKLSFNDVRRAEDLLNDTLERCLANWMGYSEKGGDHLLKWSYRIMKNRSIDMHRKKIETQLPRVRNPNDPENEVDYDPPSPLSNEQEKARELSEVLDYLDKLPKQDNEMVRLSAEGYKRSEIAKELRLPEGTVGRRLAELRLKLAAEFRNRKETDD